MKDGNKILAFIGIVLAAAAQTVLETWMNTREIKKQIKEIQNEEHPW